MEEDAMSKGWGRVERAIMAELDRSYCHSCSTIDLTGAVFGYPGPFTGGRWSITASQLRSVKRALRRLAAEGKIERDGHSYNRRARWKLVEPETKKKKPSNAAIAALERENAELRRMLSKAYPAPAETPAVEPSSAAKPEARTWRRTVPKNGTLLPRMPRPDHAR
jgi:hypothetical protein